MQGSFTTNRGELSYDQWMFSLGYRFDSKSKASRMMSRHKLAKCTARCAYSVLTLAGLCFGSTGAASPDSRKLDDLLARTGDQVSAFLDQFSDVKCTELVRQEKLGKDDKVELKEESTYDYLVILTNTAGSSTFRSRDCRSTRPSADRKNTSMLLSNGFATLFLVFHPLYAESFKFALAGEESIEGHVMNKVSFQHVRGTRSPPPSPCGAGNILWSFRAWHGSIRRPVPSQGLKLASRTPCRMWD